MKKTKKMKKTIDATYYLMRHGFKQKEEAESIKADMHEGINNIKVPETLSALENGILKELNSNQELIRIGSSPLKRALETKLLLEDLYGEKGGEIIIDDSSEYLKSTFEPQRLLVDSLDDRAGITNSVDFKDFLRYGFIEELGDGIPYFGNSPNKDFWDNQKTGRVLNQNRKNYPVFNIFSNKVGEWGIRLAEQGVNEWDRLKMYFFSDPKTKGDKPISSENFTSTISPYDKWMSSHNYFLYSLNNLKQEKILSLYKLSNASLPEFRSSVGKAYMERINRIENAIDSSKPKVIIDISHSAILEPIIAGFVYSSRKKKNLFKFSKKSGYLREMFYETLKDVVDKIGDKQWGFTEYAKVEGHFENWSDKSGKKNIFIPEKITGPGNLEYKLKR